MTHPLHFDCMMKGIFNKGSKLWGEYSISNIKGSSPFYNHLFLKLIWQKRFIGLLSTTGGLFGLGNIRD